MAHQNFISRSSSHYEGQRNDYEVSPELGYFSRDKDNQFRYDDNSALKIFRPPSNWDRCEFNLKDGQDKVEEPTFSPGTEKNRRYSLFRWIMLNKQQFHSGGNQEFSRLNTDFVCGRGSLSLLLCAPYQGPKEAEKGVKIIRFRGTYYIIENRTWEEDLARFPDKDKEIATFWGPKFEQYVTSDLNSEVPDTSQPVNKIETFYSVVRTQLGSHSLVFSSAVDCKDPDNGTYIELKTVRNTAESDPERERKNKIFWRYKVLKWWAQSVLHGIPNVVCGFPDDQGIVRRLEKFQVKDLPERAAHNINYPWQPNVCFNFLDTFLQHVKDVITEDMHVYIFKWGPSSGKVSHSKTEDPNENFLPDWFMNWDAWG